MTTNENPSALFAVIAEPGIGWLCGVFFLLRIVFKYVIVSFLSAPLGQVPDRQEFALGTTY